MDTKELSMLKSGKKYFSRYVPASLQQPLRRFCIRPLKRLVHSITSDIWLPIYRIEQSGLTVILIGHEAVDSYLIHRLYGQYVKPVRTGTLPVWSLNRAIRRWEQKADAVIFRDRKFSPEGALARRMLNIPYYVSLSIDLPPPDVDLRTVFQIRKTRDDLRKIRRADFQYEITRDPAQLDFFYHQMHRPYVQDRHRDSADCLSWDDFKQAYEKMELMLIRKAGVPVAGALNLQTGDCYAGHLLGVLNADRELLNAGAVTACYWFTIVEAHRRGCATVDTQCARPFLRDGVLAYKKKWGSRIVMDHRERGLLLLPCNSQPSMQRFLEQNPFIHEQGGRLESLIFLGSHTMLNDEELSSYLKGCHYHGDRLSTCVVLLNSEWAARAQTIQNILRELPSSRILDLSHHAVTELPELISSWHGIAPAKFSKLAYSQ